MKTIFYPLAAAAARPHVLFAVFDDLRPNASALPLRLPHLERVAAAGATFELAVSPYPVCAPARTMLLSGRGAFAAPGSAAERRLAATLAAAAATLPQWFRTHGYATLGGGKIFDDGAPLGAAAAADGAWSRGAPFYAFYGRSSKCAARRYESRNDPRCPLPVGAAGVDAGVVDWAAEALAWWKTSQANERRPFFLAAGFRRPHVPWEHHPSVLDAAPPPPSIDFPSDAPELAWSDNWGRVVAFADANQRALKMASRAARGAKGPVEISGGNFDTPTAGREAPRLDGLPAARRGSALSSRGSKVPRGLRGLRVSRRRRVWRRVEQGRAVPRGPSGNLARWASRCPSRARHPQRATKTRIERGLRVSRGNRRRNSRRYAGRDDLVVAATADHGIHLGDHGVWSKQTLFDYSLRVYAREPTARSGYPRNSPKFR